MAKQLFTPDGVQAKVAELYALSDANLHTQTALMESDFRAWLSTNFSLDANQTAYLAKMDARYLEYAGTLTATTAGARLGISLQAPKPPDKWSSKYIRTGDTPSPKYDSGSGYSVTGSLQFIIGYNQ
jgi:hypothetical protein